MFNLYDYEDEEAQNMMMGPPPQQQPPQQQMPMGPMGPQQMAPPQQMQQPPQRSFMDRMGGPGMAMAGQAITNLGNLSRDRGPVQDPTQAYQRAVSQQSLLRMREDTHKRNDPYWSYEEGKRRGHVPEEMSYFDYQDHTRQGRAKNSTYAPTIGTRNGKKVMIAPEYDQKTKKWTTTELPLDGFEPDKRGMEIDLGDKVLITDPVTGETRVELKRNLKPEQQPEYLQQVEEEKLWTKIDTEASMAFNAGIPSMRNVIGGVQGAIDMIDANPSMNTGFIEGQWTPYTDKMVAKLDALSTLLTMPALAEAGLAPVSDTDIKALKDTFAAATREPEANKAVLQLQLEWLAPRLKEMENQYNYFRETGSMRGYNSEFDLMDSPIPKFSGGKGSGPGLPAHLKPPKSR